MRLRDIHEVLDRVMPFKWASDDHATFRVGKERYSVFLDASVAKDPRIKGAGAVAIQFKRDLGMMAKLKYRFGSGPDQFGVSGTGGELAVFGTVLQVVRDFISRHPNTKCIGFIGLEANRYSLYSRLAKRNARDWVQVATPPQLMLMTRDLYNKMEAEGMDTVEFPNQYWAG